MDSWPLLTVKTWILVTAGITVWVSAVNAAPLEGTFGDAVGPVSGVPSLIAAKALRLSSTARPGLPTGGNALKASCFSFLRSFVFGLHGFAGTKPPPGSQET